MKAPELIFVYNAYSGIIPAIMDSLHKVFSPSTYDCNLCALTYTSVRMKKEWKSFIEELGVPVRFLHRDELARQYGLHHISLPSILVKEGNSLKEMVEAGEINQIRSLEHLMAVVLRKSSQILGTDVTHSDPIVLS